LNYDDDGWNTASFVKTQEIDPFIFKDCLNQNETESESISNPSSRYGFISDWMTTTSRQWLFEVNDDKVKMTST